MTTQTQSSLSFASIISILSIVLYCAGFLRVELELNEQKKRIIALENVAVTQPPSDDADIAKFFANAPESQHSKLSRKKREADSRINTTGAKHTEETMLKINKLLSQGRLKLCQSNSDTCSSGPPGLPGPPGTRGEKGTQGSRGEKGNAGNKGDRGIIGSPGKIAMQGIMGPVGPKGEAGTKGQKGDMGPAGMLGAKGEPGESISAPLVAVSPAKLTVNEGGIASFQCSVSGNPKPTIKWSKQESQTALSQSVLGGTLRLKRVTGSNSGVYKCSASNILGQAEATLQLVVNVRPRLSLHPGPHYAIEGSSFTFPACYVTGHPAPVVNWRKVSGQLPQGRVRYNNGTLQISHVRKNDSDTYFCSAANHLGRVEKKTLLVVVSPPRFTVRPPLKTAAILGCSVRLNCSPTGDSMPVVSWKKLGGQLPVGRSQQISGTLVITDLRTSDTGNYVCVATSAGVLNVETATYVEVLKGNLSESNILGSLDRKYLCKLYSYLAPVLQSSTRSRFVRCWRAKTDGWAASTFHNNCDGKGPTVIIIKVGSYIFGGYTDVFWGRPCHSASSKKSFIYSLYNINGYAPVKLLIKYHNITAYHSSAIYRCSGGPTFGGGHDIHIANNAACNRNSYTYCGWTYPLPPGYSSSGLSCTFYAGSYKFTPTDVEVFYETTT